jgi:hypothetical protein
MVNPRKNYLEEIAKNLTKFFETCYLATMQIFDLPRAQTVSQNDSMSNECVQYYWYQLCGPPIFTVENSQSRPFGDITCSEHHPSTHVKGRRLSIVFFPPGSCTGLTTNFNLLNTGV